MEAARVALAGIMVPSWHALHLLAGKLVRNEKLCVQRLRAGLLPLPLVSPAAIAH